MKLVGIDAPELDKYKGSEAKAYVESLLSQGDNVRLWIDEKEPIDAYDRILAVVFVENSGSWINLNANLLQQGHARILHKPPSQFYSNQWEWFEGQPFAVGYERPQLVTPAQLLANTRAHDNQLVRVAGFVSNVENRTRYTDAGPIWYTVFEISTYENDNLKIPVLWRDGHLNTNNGVENGSYVELFAIFFENHPTTNGPNLHAQPVRIASSAEIVLEYTPKSWEVVEPWAKRAYLRDGFTRAWEVDSRTGAQGWLQAASRRLASVYTEYEENLFWFALAFLIGGAISAGIGYARGDRDLWGIGKNFIIGGFVSVTAGWVGYKLMGAASAFGIGATIEQHAGSLVFGYFSGLLYEAGATAYWAYERARETRGNI